MNSECQAVCRARHLDRIPRAEILSKIAELSIGNKGDVDLWVLGATTEVGSQLADDVQALGEKNGISALVLDWSESGLPPLASALAMAGTATEDFLKRMHPTAVCSAIPVMTSRRSIGLGLFPHNSEILEPTDCRPLDVGKMEVFAERLFPPIVGGKRGAIVVTFHNSIEVVVNVATK